MLQWCWLFPVSAVLAFSMESLNNIVVADTLNVTGSEIFALNSVVGSYIQEVCATPYFSQYRVDLSEDSCPFVDETGTCGNRACAIEPLEENAPWELQSQYLGKLRKDSTTNDEPGCVSEDIFAYSSHDYCYPEDDNAANGALWVDLNANLERYTGYAGPHAHKVWNAVYQENCFGYSGDSENEYLADVFDDRHARQEVGGEAGQLAMNMDQQCLEQRLFYRLLSGMHSSISTHLSYDYLNQSTAQWGPNLDEFMSRVGHHPERINNMLFDYVLLSRAIQKLQTYLQLLSFSSTCPSVDAEVRFELHKIGSYLSKNGKGINDTALFNSTESKALKNEFRKRVRNVNELMSCVGCERCRLWGKIQTAGYGTALKLLFELPEDPQTNLVVVSEVLAHFKRSEIVALIQTFSRICHSVDALQYFASAYTDSRINKFAFSYQWSQAMHQTREALGFILQSYIDFPKNLWRLFIFHANIYWNQFVGKTVSLTLLDKRSV